MNKCISLFLILVLILSGCSSRISDNPSLDTTSSESNNSDKSVIVAEIITDPASGVIAEEGVVEDWTPDSCYTSLNDEDLLQNMEDTIYSSLLEELDGEDYYIENVEATFVSKEYIEELSYNSQANIFFGYTLAELNQEFQGTRYVFTLDDNGETTVRAFESYDDTYEKVLKNVTIGTGVVLICVTVSAVTAGTAPAISMIFAVSAKTGTAAALSGGAIGGLSSGIITGIQTGDFDQVIKAAMVGASEGYKLGAITGVISGGIGETIALKGATANGLTMNEVAMMQRESQYPLSIIKQFRNVQEYEIYKNAGLSSEMINGKIALIQNIDLESVVDIQGRTNVQRILDGLSPLDPATGHAYELHHVGQHSESIIALLSREQHDLPGLHPESFGVDHGADWQKIVRQFWKSYIKARGYL